MKWGYWLVAALLLAVAGGSVWYAFHSPGFVAGLSALAAGAFWKAIAPAILKSSPETQAEAKRRTDQGEGPITPRDRPPNVTTGKVTVKPADTNRDHRGESHH